MQSAHTACVQALAAQLALQTVTPLEVQRMTLSTLQTMNLPMADLRDALTLPTTAARPPATSITSSPSLSALPNLPRIFNELEFSSGRVGHYI